MGQYIIYNVPNKKSNNLLFLSFEEIINLNQLILITWDQKVSNDYCIIERNMVLCLFWFKRLTISEWPFHLASSMTSFLWYPTWLILAPFWTSNLTIESLPKYEANPKAVFPSISSFSKVLPPPFFKMVIADAKLPFQLARWRSCLPLNDFFWTRSGYKGNIYFKTSTLLLSVAQDAQLRPFFACLLTFEPKSSKYFITFMWPSMQLRINGVVPSRLPFIFIPESRLAPWLTKYLTTWIFPLALALWRGVLPSKSLEFRISFNCPFFSSCIRYLSNTP